jgi:sigma-54 dependent transcriptional regulator, acetoin dehydrogenase operon transcriptional activator AcoR
LHPAVSGRNLRGKAVLLGGTSEVATNSIHIDRVLASIAGVPGALTHRPTQIGRHIVTSWRRCLTEYGLEPHTLRQTPVLSLGELKSSQESVEDLLVVAEPELRRLLIHLQKSDYILTMTNAQGVAVLARYASSLRAEVERARTVVGSVWLEEHQGTNGIGTCLKEQMPLSVVMDDHFGVRLVGLSCTVAPLFNGDGSLLGVINVTTPRPSSHEMQAMVRRAVSLSARRIENLHLQRQYAGTRILRLARDNDFADLAQETRLVIDGSGRMLAATPGIAELLGVDAQALIGRPISDVLDLRDSAAAADDDPIALHRPGELPLFVHTLVRRHSRSGTPPQTRLPRPAAPRVPQPEEASRLAVRLLARGLPILLQGETGSGKSALARLLHDAGPRAKRPFVAVNCGAIPGELIEGELFGYVPGAYTGALRTGAKGLIRAADGGTLFLDEIGDMPAALQTRLLHVLSEGEVVPLGAVKGVRVDIAVIAATLHDISALVRRKQFRADLYFRLNGATLTLPPLRDRADRQQIVGQIWHEEAGRASRAGARLSDTAVAALRTYRWPGNLRELRHALRYALAVADGLEVTVDDLPPHIGRTLDGHCRLDAAMLERTLAETNWNVSAAARQLGISRATLHRKVPTSALRPRRGPISTH